jgi:hypothetical protein
MLELLLQPGFPARPMIGTPESAVQRQSGDPHPRRSRKGFRGGHRRIDANARDAKILV